MQMDDEEALVNAFIISTKKARYKYFLSRPRLRKRFTSELGHFKGLDLRFVVPIPPSQHHPAEILTILKSKGAGTLCRVISENWDIDGHEVDLLDALEITVGRQMGTFLSCVPGKLAYFEDEDIRCILQR